MSSKILILNGPNLNMLGVRQPEIYGSETLADVEARCAVKAKALGLEADCRQSNSEGELVTWIQDARQNHAGIVINAGAYTHTSLALLDALKVSELPVMEVHISNVHQREEYRHFSYISQVAYGSVIGCGTYGYEMALDSMAQKLKS